MTDQQKIRLLMAALIVNTVTAQVVYRLMLRDHQFLAEKYNDVYDALGVALETCDTSDERLQRWATNVEFDLMTDKHLKSLKRKGWWRR